MIFHWNSISIIHMRYYAFWWISAKSWITRHHTDHHFQKYAITIEWLRDHRSAPFESGRGSRVWWWKTIHPKSFWIYLSKFGSKRMTRLWTILTILLQDISRDFPTRVCCHQELFRANQTDILWHNNQHLLITKSHVYIWIPCREPEKIFSTRSGEYNDRSLSNEELSSFINISDFNRN
jgi:hypothetical protein